MPAGRVNAKESRINVTLNLLALVLILFAVPPCAYLLLATMLSGRLPLPTGSSRRMRFVVVVPAHNEELVIARTVASLRALDWPQDRYRIQVVADNCTDATAEIARAGGAEVLQRHDAVLRGKGHALQYAFGLILAEPWAEAIVVVDADSKVSTNLLEACAARLECGADAVQVHYGVLNAHDSWRTRLMAIALAAFHEVRSRARARLSLSCGIRGNGWCLRRNVLTRVPYRSFSLAEDIEYGIELGVNGIRVHYAAEAAVLGEMVSDAASAATQRKRWESGRLDLVATRIRPLWTAIVRQRSRICLDLLCDLLVPPLSYVVAGIAALATVGVGESVLAGAPTAATWIAAACGGAVVVYVLRGWSLSGVGPRGALDLAYAPFYVLWKFALMLKRRRPQSWVRTNRGGS